MAPVDVHVKHIINKLVMQIFCLGQYILEYGIFQHLKYLSPFRIWPKYMNTYHNNVALVPVNLVWKFSRICKWIIFANKVLIGQCRELTQSQLNINRGIINPLSANLIDWVCYPFCWWLVLKGLRSVAKLSF